MNESGDDHNKYMLNQMNRINSTISAFVGTPIEPEVIEIKESTVVCLIKVEQNTKLIFLNFKEHAGNVYGWKFFVDQTGQTIVLAANELHLYISKYFDWRIYGCKVRGYLHKC